jgi:hypothetical protein
MTVIIIAVIFSTFMVGALFGWLLGVSSPEDDLRYVAGHVAGYRKAMKDAGGDWT